MPKYNLNKIVRSIPSLDFRDYQDFMRAYNHGTFTMDEISHFARMTESLIRKHHLISTGADSSRKMVILLEKMPTIETDDFI